MTDDNQGSGAVDGLLAEGFGRVGLELERCCASDPDLSAQFCAYVNGIRVVDIWAGPDIQGSDLLGVFSATKGAAATCIALLVGRGSLRLDSAVSDYWPEFAQGGKEAVSVRALMSHQAGLVGVDPQFTLSQLLDHDYLARSLAAQAPHWRPGAFHGYHALTIGTLMDELVRRVDGRPIAQFLSRRGGPPPRCRRAYCNHVGH